MKPFRFRLQRLLHLGEGEKKQLASEMAVRRSELEEAEAACATQEQIQQRAEESYARLSVEGGPASGWIGAQLSIHAASRQVKRGEDAIRAAMIKLEEARERLVEKSREVETYVRLRQRRLEEHHDESLRQAQKVLDEVANVRSARVRAEGKESAEWAEIPSVRQGHLSSGILKCSDQSPQALL